MQISLHERVKKVIKGKVAGRAMRVMLVHNWELAYLWNLEKERGRLLSKRETVAPASGIMTRGHHQSAVSVQLVERRVFQSRL